MGLNKPRKVKRVLPKRTPKPLDVLPIANHQWALDFMHDSLYCGKTFRTLNVIDEGTRECLAIEIDTSLLAARVIRVLEQLKQERGLPINCVWTMAQNLFQHNWLIGVTNTVLIWRILNQVSHNKTAFVNDSMVHLGESF